MKNFFACIFMGFLTGSSVFAMNTLLGPLWATWWVAFLLGCFVERIAQRFEKK